MERFTISLDDSLAAEFDELIAERGVRHGQLNPITVELHGAQGLTHVHLKPSR